MTGKETNEYLNGTAGLTSASQIIDFTDSTTYSIENTTSAIPETILGGAHEHGAEMPELRLPRPSTFGRILRKSIRRNRDLLTELAKH